MLHSWPEYVDLTRAVGRLGANPSRSIACACSLNGYDFWFEFLSVNARNCIPIGQCGVIFAVSATIRLDHTVKSRCAIGCTREVLKPPGKGTNDERRSAVCVSRFTATHVPRALRGSTTGGSSPGFCPAGASPTSGP